MILDKEWTEVKNMLSSPDVRAVLLQKKDTSGGVSGGASGGVVRVEGKVPAKFTLSDRVKGVVLVAADPDETIYLMGHPYVRCFRRLRSGP